MPPKTHKQRKAIEQRNGSHKFVKIVVETSNFVPNYDETDSESDELHALTDCTKSLQIQAGAAKKRPKIHFFKKQKHFLEFFAVNKGKRRVLM